MIFKSSDTYQAAWLIMNGAEFISFEKREVKGHKGDKLGFHKKWVITLMNVSKDALKEWNNGYAEGRMRDFADARKKLKRQIKNYENRHSR